MAAKGEITPMPSAAFFADTQAEPESVYKWLSYLCGVEVKYKDDVAYVEAGIYRGGVIGAAFPVYIITKGSLTDKTLTMHTSRVSRPDGKPGGYLYSSTDIPFYTLAPDGTKGKIRQRGCTRDFKIRPLITENRKFAGRDAMTQWRRKHKSALKVLSHWKSECVRIRREAKKLGVKNPQLPFRPHEAWMECQGDPLVIQWIGISMDEATRMKDSRDFWIASRWPLIEKQMHRKDCLLWMQKNGYPKPPRSACIYCPFHNNAEWKRLKELEPKEFQRAVKFELDLQRIKAGTGNFTSKPFLHRSLLMLDKVDFSDAGEQDLMAENECEGMCGV